MISERKRPTPRICLGEIHPFFFENELEPEYKLFNITSVVTVVDRDPKSRHHFPLDELPLDSHGLKLFMCCAPLVLCSVGVVSTTSPK